jgi:hypothetical protein
MRDTLCRATVKSEAGKEFCKRPRGHSGAHKYCVGGTGIIISWPNRNKRKRDRQKSIRRGKP